MKNKVLTLGEVLMRLSPPSRERFIDNRLYEINYGGAELNVAVNLANWGVSTRVVSAVPDNEIGKASLRHLRGFGIDTNYIQQGGERLGIYFLENGHSIRSSKVIYDRKNSSFATMDFNNLDLDSLLEGVSLFHVSGITLALSQNTFDLAKALMVKAKEKEIKVTFDFNYRSKLWSLEEATLKINEILDYVDIAFAGYLDFVNILGFEELKGENIDASYERLYPQVMDKYNLEYIVSSKREVLSASHNIYQGLVYHRNKLYCSKIYNINIIDRVGSGDAFTSGFLYSYLNDKDIEYMVEFATASASLKHTIMGDCNLVSASEVEVLFQDNSYDVGR